MVFVQSSRTSFNNVGIDTSTEIEVDGKIIKHVELFTADQLQSIRFNTEFAFIDTSAVVDTTVI